ncbi:hypothetical protein G9A89_007914 [Geosiphon pyriformis]|nr:hypothetical protein G9A89_007914 [Geosiphon pyriformis]
MHLLRDLCWLYYFGSAAMSVVLASVYLSFALIECPILRLTGVPNGWKDNEYERDLWNNFSRKSSYKNSLELLTQDISKKAMKHKSIVLCTQIFR